MSLIEPNQLELNEAGKRLQRTVAGFADSEETRAAMQDLAAAGPWTANQLVQVRWLLIQVLIQTHKQRAHAEATRIAMTSKGG